MTYAATGVHRRRVRHEISAEFGHDVDRVVDYYRSVEEELKHSGRFRFAALATGPELSDVVTS